jgi:hypothetical protein
MESTPPIKLFNRDEKLQEPFEPSSIVRYPPVICKLTQKNEFLNSKQSQSHPAKVTSQVFRETLVASNPRVRRT